MHLRKDVTESLLLEGRLRSIRLDGTSVVANPNYVWHRARGPAWLRPPRYGDCWYPYMSQGFGPFETMALAEKAGLEFVTIGINIRAETPETAADMMDCKSCKRSLAILVLSSVSQGQMPTDSFAPAGTTPMAKLRASDGHAEPYPPTLVVELGNEEGNSDYLSHTIPILTAMRARLQKVSPQAYARVRFAFAYNNWDSPMGDALASAAYNVTDGAACMTWDQHGKS